MSKRSLTAAGASTATKGQVISRGPTTSCTAPCAPRATSTTALYVNVTNNVFAFPEVTLGAPVGPSNDFSGVHYAPARSGHESISSFSFHHNIVLLRNVSATLFFRSTSTAFRNTTFDYNLYWSYALPPSALWFPTWVGRTTLLEWQALGHDVHGVVADPQLASLPDSLDFSHFSATSPIWALGIQAISTADVGPIP